MTVYKAQQSKFWFGKDVNQNFVHERCYVHRHVYFEKGLVCKVSILSYLLLLRQMRMMFTTHLPFLTAYYDITVHAVSTVDPASMSRPHMHRSTMFSTIDRVRIACYTYLRA